MLYVPQHLVVRYGGHVDQLSQRHWGMDRFRVRALEKLLGDRGLRPEYRSAALHTVIKKLDVLIGGARKRGHADFVRECEERRAAHLESLQGLRTTRVA